VCLATKEVHYGTAGIEVVEELLSNVVDGKSLRSLGRRGFGISSRRPHMPEIARRFRCVPWPQTGAEPLSGFGWGVFEKPGPLAEGDFSFRPNDLVKLCMIKRLPS